MKHKGKALRKTTTLINSKNVGIFFLGVGVALFAVNIASIFTVRNVIPYMTSLYGPYIMNGYYVSLVTSIIVIIYSLYEIKKKE